MTPKRRELMHRAMDGTNDLAGVMHILHGYKFCDNILIWLISHKYTGQHLKDLIVKRFHSSVPALVNYVVSAANGRLTDGKNA